MDQQINELIELLPNLKTNDAGFAADLISSYKKYGKLTPKQQPWIGKLIDRAKNPTPETKVVVNVGAFVGVVNLLKQAAQHLKHPKIALTLNGLPIFLSVSGNASKTPGFVQIVGEGSYPNRPWYGRVSPGGSWEPSKSVDNATLTALGQLLTDLGNDPAKVAAEHGKLTGKCCFCNSSLTDPKSTAVGFGPVCAEHYGLKQKWHDALHASILDKTIEQTMTKAVEQELSAIEKVVLGSGDYAVGDLMVGSVTDIPSCQMCNDGPGVYQVSDLLVCGKCKQELE